MKLIDMKGLITIPELPEVECTRISLETKLIGKKIIGSDVFENKISEKALKKLLRKQSKNQFIEHTIGCRFISVERRAKFLMTKVEKEGKFYYILVHLAMAGKFLYTQKLEDLLDLDRKHILVQFSLDDGTFLVYSDHRRFGAVSIYSEEEFKQLPSLKGLGPEPFDDDAEEIFLKNLTKKKYQEKPIKGVIMDQSTVAGVGNIYACEAMWYSKTHPLRAVNTLQKEKLAEIFQYAKNLMEFSISVGGSSVKDYVDGDGKKGSFQDYLKVYGRSHCFDCRTPIERIEVEGRTTHFCPKCQV